MHRADIDSLRNTIRKILALKKIKWFATIRNSIFNYLNLNGIGAKLKGWNGSSARLIESFLVSRKNLRLPPNPSQGALKKGSTDSCRTCASLYYNL